ncbi:hypothetical protein [Kineosporia sp. NBRC 101731]|uniref:hypothetical protein n=1 Tax=Kineosporia sp. NBRC 101731 TaxID=3032199 RepID=UPI0024A05A57|nr:hypothetical protein [Kineosporia sp. NBRC 101731]GLY33623.1 hypothetical protein Kisp02_69880 [Kineosporia sp. NBRC 101731]
MVADFITWLCKSPRRLVVVSLSAIILIFVIGSAAVGDNEKSNSNDSGDDLTRAAVTAAVVPASDQYVSAAVNFVRLWAELKPGETSADWLAALTPLATQDYATALKSTDTATLPGTQPEGEPVVRFLAQESSMIAVPLADGSSVLVTVVAGEGTSEPMVSDVQPNTGD